MTKPKGMLIIFFCLSAFIIFGLFAYRGGSPKMQNVFAYTDIVIAPEQIVKTLMVAGADATVRGSVTENIFVVDGDLNVQNGAKISGRIFVLGGNLTVSPAASLKQRPLVFFLHGHPFVPLIVALLFLLGAASLILLPVLFWLLGHYFKKSPLYLPAKEQLQRIQDRWPELYVMVGFALSVSLLIAFLALSWKTFFKNSTVLFDDAFIWLVRYFASPALDKAMLLITDIGFGTSYAVIVSVTLLLLAYRRRWSEIFAIAVCLSGAGLLSVILKNLFQRVRPDSFFLVQETSFSFPSGHALATMCFYGLLAFLLMRNMTSWSARLLVATLTIVLSLAIGISRIYLGVHYPTDVVAGYAVGFMWLTFCISLLLRRENAQSMKN